MESLQWKILLRWIIGWYPNLRNPPHMFMLFKKVKVVIFPIASNTFTFIHSGALQALSRLLRDLERSEAGRAGWEFVPWPGIPNRIAHSVFREMLYNLEGHILHAYIYRVFFINIANNYRENGIACARGLRKRVHFSHRSIDISYINGKFYRLKRNV